MRHEAVEMTPSQSGRHRQQLVDRLVRAANGKRDLPPIHLRRYVGPLRSFESLGAEFVAYLKLVARLAPHESLLDIGCGCDLIALGLQDYLSTTGAYVGLDIHNSVVPASDSKQATAVSIRLDRRTQCHLPPARGRSRRKLRPAGT